MNALEEAKIDEVEEVEEQDAEMPVEEWERVFNAQQARKFARMLPTDDGKYLRISNQLLQKLLRRGITH